MLSPPRACACLLGLAMLSACNPDEGSTSETASTTHESTGASPTTTTPTTTTSPDPVDGAWRPEACPVDASPFLSEECLGALRGACFSHGNAEDCNAEGGLSFQDGAYVIRCGWAKVVRFTDAKTCAVASTMGRCEVTLDAECGDACAGDFMLGDVSAIPEALEVIQLCGGPIGQWSAVNREPGSYLSTCGPNLEPPAPELCNCLPQACAAE